MSYGAFVPTRLVGLTRERALPLNAAHTCATLSVTNGDAVQYTDPAGAFGQKQEGSAASFSCRAGYQKSGNKGTRTCANGAWGGSAQTCTGAYAGPHGAVVGASVTLVS